MSSLASSTNENKVSLENPEDQHPQWNHASGGDGQRLDKGGERPPQRSSLSLLIGSVEAQLLLQ